jgi:hypothetical protein
MYITRIHPASVVDTNVYCQGQSQWKHVTRTQQQLRHILNNAPNVSSGCLVLLLQRHCNLKYVEAVRNVMAHGDAWEGKWRGNRRLERVAATLALYLRTWSINGLPADPRSSTASSRLNWLPCQFKWTRPFLWKTKPGFCACAITFQTRSTQDVPQPTVCQIPECHYQPFWVKNVIWTCAWLSTVTMPHVSIHCMIL